MTVIIESQREVVSFLSSPVNFGGAPVQRIDTHLSHVFLVGARVYKIKRAVRYDFADFSTLERRKAACENEVRINRRTAPGMYLGVVPIYRDEKGVGWEPAGDLVEWAVEMARFEPGSQFDEMLAHDRLREADIEKLADKIAEFHLSAESVKSADAGRGVVKVIDQLTTALHDRGVISEEAVQRWSALARAEFAKHEKRLNARGRHGWTRHCHGDLHLANICMFKGEPALFDAIEFNDSLAQTDVLYDLAFLTMDLVKHRRDDLANVLLNRYLSATCDYGGVKLLPLFQSMRACVRAMVLSLAAQPEKSHRRAQAYFDLALEYLVRESEPRLVAIGGYSGTGKSTLARCLARKLDHRRGAIVLRSDVIRKRLAGVSPEATISPEHYTDEQTAAVYKRLFKDARRAMRARQAVIMDATFLAPPLRRSAEAIARQADVPFTGIWLTAPRDILMSRVSSRAPDASDATVDVVRKQIAEGQAAKGWQIVDAGESPKTTLRNTLGVLSSYGP